MLFHSGLEMMRIRVLIVGPLPPTVGGITTCIMNILRSDLKRDHFLIPFTTSRPTEDLNMEVYDYTILFKVGLKHLVKSALATIYHLMQFPIVLIVQNPKLIHIHTTDYLPFWESSIYVFIAKMFFKKTILHIHATTFDKFYKDSNVVLSFLIRKTLHMADKIIVLSPRWKNFFTKLIPERKLVIIPNGVSVSVFNNQLKRKAFSSDDIQVLFIGGKESKRKGVYDILKAIPIVVKKHTKNILFLFVGRTDVNKLRNFCEKKGISNHVKILGYIENDSMMEIMATADIYVLPSYAEGLPIAMLEAMAAGLPVVSTPVGSIPEVIEEGVNGFLVKPGDHNALAARIIELTRNERLRKRMGINNMEKIRKEYSMKKVMERLGIVYRGNA
jgi:glycosyltransferase involved in cell wall biosynthesis